MTTTSLSNMNQDHALRMAYQAYPRAAGERDILPLNKLIWQNINNVPVDKRPSFVQLSNWNKQLNSSGKLENSFEIFVNKDTREIGIAFKGSDNGSNYLADIKNAGSTEYFKIADKAQAALNALRSNPDYQGYKIYTTGHSLGGGFAQTFALKNGLDAFVYNSLPIAPKVIESGYFGDKNFFNQKVAQYRQNNQAYSLNTTSDIATNYYTSDIASYVYGAAPYSDNIFLSSKPTFIGSEIIGGAVTAGAGVLASILPADKNINQSLNNLSKLKKT